VTSKQCSYLVYISQLSKCHTVYLRSPDGLLMVHIL